MNRITTYQQRTAQLISVLPEVPAGVPAQGIQGGRRAHFFTGLLTPIKF